MSQAINDVKSSPDENEIKDLMQICTSSTNLQAELEAEKDRGLLATIYEAYSHLSMRGKGVCAEQIIRELVKNKEVK